MSQPLPRTPKRLAPIPGQNVVEDQTLAMIVALTSETIILRARLDTCERLLIAANIIPGDAIETFEPDSTAQAERDALRLASMHKIFRALYETAETERATIQTDAPKENVQ